MEDIRTCSICGKELVRRKNERIKYFNRRKCCSHKCAGAMPNVEGRDHTPKEHTTTHTKYGGSRLTKKKVELKEWNCQLCGEEQTEGMPQFLYEVFPDEYIRVCGICYCQSKVYESFESIKRLSKTVANYVTYELKPYYGKTTTFKSSFLSLSALD